MPVKINYNWKTIKMLIFRDLFKPIMFNILVINRAMVKDRLENKIFTI